MPIIHRVLGYELKTYENLEEFAQDVLIPDAQETVVGRIRIPELIAYSFHYMQDFPTLTQTTREAIYSTAALALIEEIHKLPPSILVGRLENARPEILERAVSNFMRDVGYEPEILIGYRDIALLALYTSFQLYVHGNLYGLYINPHTSLLMRFI